MRSASLVRPGRLNLLGAVLSMTLSAAAATAAPAVPTASPWSGAAFATPAAALLAAAKALPPVSDQSVDFLLFESRLTPEDIHQRYRVLNGAIYGLASHGKWLGAFKPANRSPDVRGLYLAGGSAHPGPGMPMALMSVWIAADTLDQDARRKTKPTAIPTGGLSPTPCLSWA